MKTPLSVLHHFLPALLAILLLAPAHLYAQTPPTAREALIDTGRSHEAQGRYREALAYYLKAEALSTKDTYFKADLNVPRAAYLAGDYKRALPRLEAKYHEALREGEPGLVDTALTTYTRALTAARQYPKALQVAQRALAHYHQMGYAYGSPQGMNALVTLMQAQGLYAQALPLALHRLQLSNAIQDDLDYAEGLYLAANSHRAMGHADKALPLYQQSLALREKLLPAMHPLIAQSRLAQSQTHKAKRATAPPQQVQQLLQLAKQYMVPAPGKAARTPAQLSDPV